MKITSTSILKVCAGIAIIILSAAVFNLTIPRAHAETKNLIDQSTSQIGKYCVSMTACPSGTDILYTIIVMDTETGKAKTYSDKTSSSFGPTFYISSTAPAGY